MRGTIIGVSATSDFYDASAYRRRMLLRVTASAFNDRGPLFMEQALAAVHEGLTVDDTLTLTVGRTEAGVGQYLALPKSLRPLVEGQLASQYPSARVERVAEASVAEQTGDIVFIREVVIGPANKIMRPYTDHRDADSRLPADPLSGFIAALAAGEHDPLKARFDITLRPARSRRRRAVVWATRQFCRRRFIHSSAWRKLFVACSMSGSFPLRLAGRILAWTAGPRTTTDMRGTDAAGDKLDQRLFEAHLRLVVTGPGTSARRARAKLDELAAAIAQFSDPQHAEIRVRSTDRVTSLRTPQYGESLLTAAEVAAFWHLPTVALDIPALDVATHRRLPSPSAIPHPRSQSGAGQLGETSHGDHRTPVGILPDDRRRHLYIVGKTGMGKSTLLQNLIGDDIAAGQGCCLIDPHGDLADAVLAAVPSQRTNDAVLFDAGDRAYPIAFNPLADASPEQRPLVASAVLTAFKKIYADSWGPRLEYIFRNCLLTLLETPGATLVSLARLLSDARYRDLTAARLTDPVIRAFWQQEFASMPVRFQAEAIAPIQNKVGQFVASPLLRHILGQPRNAIDIRSIMDSGKVLIVNLSKGRIGEDASGLLGALLVSSVQLAAMSRADTEESTRQDFHLYVDEFQSFATDSFASILSEARKYRVCLTLANQYMAQVDEAVTAAVFGNVGSLLSFQVGANDAQIIAEQLGGQVTPADLLAVPRYEAYLRLLTDGEPSRAFSIRTLAAQRKGDPQRAEIIRRRSQRYYAHPLAAVEREIAAMVG